MSPASYQTAPPRVALPRRLDVSSSFLWRAGNGTRTRDPNLGKVVLYQLSYSRAPPNLTAQGAGIYHPYTALRGTVRPSGRPAEWRRGGSNP